MRCLMERAVLETCATLLSFMLCQSEGSSVAASSDEQASYVWPTSPSWLKGPKSPYRGAVSGGSGGASFGLGSAGAGKGGVAAFVGSPWQGPAAAPPVRLGVAGAAAGAAPAPAAQAADAATAGQGSAWNLASLQQRLQSLGLAGVMAYGECHCGVADAKTARQPANPGWSAAGCLSHLLATCC